MEFEVPQVQLHASPQPPKTEQPEKDESIANVEPAKKDEHLSAPIPVKEATKSMAEIGIQDVKFKLNENKSFEEQAEDVVNAMAIANAVQDEEVVKQLTEHKAEELRHKSESKSKQAEKESLRAETEKQNAERELYEGVLQTFGITKHLPKWLMAIMITVLSPLYLLLTLLIGVPFGFVKTIIDNIDNVLCRYERVDEKLKPHLKFTVWILLAVGAVAAVAIFILKLLNKI